MPENPSLRAFLYLILIKYPAPILDPNKALNCKSYGAKKTTDDGVHPSGGIQISGLHYIRWWLYLDFHLQEASVK